MMSREQLAAKFKEFLHIGRFIDRADHIITMSQILKDVCVREGVAGDKVTVLGNRVDTRRFSPDPDCPHDPATIHVLFVGRLLELKNLHGITAALSLLRGQGWKVHIDICGGAGINDYLRRCLGDLRPGEYVYRNTVPNRRLCPFYQKSDMYVGPSFWEGFQIPLIEALACGTPCVASDQAPANEILSAEVAEFVDPSDAGAIASGILRLKERLNDPIRRESIRQACRRQALERWDYFVISRKEAQVYLDAMLGTEP
jgi:glycosyltransferase involved in cell wall biosynthesis